MIDAEKSDPPRPSVVGRPSSVEPLNPVTTGRMRCSSSGRDHRRGAFRGSGFHQRRRVAEHRVGGDHVRGVHRRRRECPAIPDIRPSAARKAVRRWRWLRRSSAAAARPASCMPLAMRENSEISACTPASAGFLPRAPAAIRGSFEVPRSQRLQIRVEIRLIARFGLAQRIEQQVGDLRHGRNHDHHRPLGVLLRARSARPRGCARPSPCWCRRISLPEDRSYLSRSSAFICANSKFAAAPSSESPPPPAPAEARWNRDIRHRAPASAALRVASTGRAGRVRRFPARPRPTSAPVSRARRSARDLRVGVQKNLHLRVRKHHRADVAALHHHRVRRADAPLLLAHGPAHARRDRHLRSRIATPPARESPRSRPRRSEVTRSPSNSIRAACASCSRRCMIVEIDSRPQRPQRHRAVHRAGVDIGESQPPRRATARWCSSPRPPVRQSR